MVGKAKMELSSVTIDTIRPTRDASKLDHEFKMKAKVKVSKRALGPISGEGIESLELEWKETIDWFECDAGGAWKHKELEKVKDMYAAAPQSYTFKTWQEMRYFFASVTEVNVSVPKALTDAMAKGVKTKEKDDAAKHWIAANGHEWTVAITDRPGLGLKPVSTSGGGGGASKVTSDSRRRVIQFDLGFKKAPQRATATQILETVKGVPTIHKFIIPAISKAQADDPNNLAAWRAELLAGPQ